MDAPAGEHAMLEQGMGMDGAPYPWWRDGKDGRRTWVPEMSR